MNKQKETLNFNNFTGYYGAVPNGYGGFNWANIEYFNKSGGAAASEDGYQNIIKGRGEAGFGHGGGYFESANLSKFSLKSMLVAAGNPSGDPVFFTSYTYSDGKLIEKARDVVYVTPDVQKIDFAKIGGKGDFQKIAAVFMVVGSARYGAHYGHAAIGDGMIFDNMTVEWNGKIPHGESAQRHGSALLQQLAHAANSGGDVGHPDDPKPDGNQHHAAVVTPDVPSGHAGHSGHFALPEPDHFGM